MFNQHYWVNLHSSHYQTRFYDVNFELGLGYQTEAVMGPCKVHLELYAVQQLFALVENISMEVADHFCRSTRCKNSASLSIRCFHFLSCPFGPLVCLPKEPLKDEYFCLHRHDSRVFLCKPGNDMYFRLPTPTSGSNNRSLA